uniref:Uncharacterized protein n=1 Tax=Cacopsylla melanoneura TaxID=428564 RepID=A0A8D8VRS2_9HEMI
MSYIYVKKKVKLKTKKKRKKKNSIQHQDPTPKTCILYGSGSKFMDTASFRGRKFAHSSFIQHLRATAGVQAGVHLPTKRTPASSAVIFAFSINTSRAKGISPFFS